MNIAPLEEDVQQHIRAELNYDPETGVFTWKRARRGIKPGMEAGNIGPLGYRRINICHRFRAAHRLAWFMHFGVWPESPLDHINGNKADNRICNLRLADHSQNKCNTGRRSDNKTGAKGVYWSNRRRRWVAGIALYGAYKHLGVFREFEEAVEARRHGAMRLHKEFARL